MNVRRGDIVLVLYPFVSGRGGSRRPAPIVQNDADNTRLRNTIVTQITANLRRVAEPTHLLIEWSTRLCTKSNVCTKKDDSAHAKSRH